MKVLHVGAPSVTGGADVALVRVHEMLQGTSADLEFSSHVFARTRDENLDQSHAGESAEPGSTTVFRRFETRLVRAVRIWARNNSSDLQSFPQVSSTGLAQEIRDLQPDIVHLHWLGKDMASLSDLRNLSGPVVWTLHDQWPLLGTRHYRLEDSRWAGLLCGWEKPSLGVRFLDTALSVVKSAIYSKKFHFIAPSSWMADYALTRGIPANRIHTLPPPLPVGDLGHVPWEVTRSDWLGKRWLNILFVSAHGAKDARKGFSILQQVLARPKVIGSLSHRVNIWVVGDFSDPKSEKVSDARISHLGPLDQERLKSLLDQADLLFTPSVAEAFGLTVQEALARGTKVMMLDGVGLSAELRNFPGVFLVPDSKNLLSGVSDSLIALLNNPERWDFDKKSVAKRARELWSPDVLRNAYLEVYREVLG